MLIICPPSSDTNTYFTLTLPSSWHLVKKYYSLSVLSSHFFQPSYLSNTKYTTSQIHIISLEIPISHLSIYALYFTLGNEGRLFNSFFLPSASFCCGAPALLSVETSDKTKHVLNIQGNRAGQLFQPLFPPSIIINPTSEGAYRIEAKHVSLWWRVH